MKVGFVGLGHMGSGMAASLLKAGHEVIVYNRTRAIDHQKYGETSSLIINSNMDCGRLLVARHHWVRVGPIGLVVSFVRLGPSDRRG